MLVQNVKDEDSYRNLLQEKRPAIVGNVGS